MINQKERELAVNFLTWIMFTKAGHDLGDCFSEETLKNVQALTLSSMKKSAEQMFDRYLETINNN